MYIHFKTFLCLKRKSWVPERESTREIYKHIPPIYGFYNGCIGQYGVMFGEQLLRYPPKGTQYFPLNVAPKKISFLGLSDGEIFRKHPIVALVKRLATMADCEMLSLGRTKHPQKTKPGTSPTRWGGPQKPVINGVLTPRSGRNYICNNDSNKMGGPNKNSFFHGG